jgi:hypothetical protein
MLLAHRARRSWQAAACLAVLLLALAPLGRAAILPPQQGCTPSSVRLELTGLFAVSFGPFDPPPDCAANSIAKCFNSITVATTADCVLTVTPNDPGSSSDVRVNSLFGMSFGRMTSYRWDLLQLAACPAAGDAALSTTIADDGAALAGLHDVLAGSIWEAATPSLGALQLENGVLTVADSSDPDNNNSYDPYGHCALTWRSVQASGVFAVAACTNAGPECAATPTACVAGRYGVPIVGAAGAACPLCRAGESRGRASLAR